MKIIYISIYVFICFMFFHNSTMFWHLIWGKYADLGHVLVLPPEAMQWSKGQFEEDGVWPRVWNNMPCQATCKARWYMTTTVKAITCYFQWFLITQNSSKMVKRSNLFDFVMVNGIVMYDRDAAHLALRPCAYLNDPKSQAVHCPQWALSLTETQVAVSFSPWRNRWIYTVVTVVIYIYIYIWLYMYVWEEMTLTQQHSAIATMILFCW